MRFISYFAPYFIDETEDNRVKIPKENRRLHPMTFSFEGSPKSHTCRAFVVLYVKGQERFANIFTDGQLYD